jgi:hypothetical protein
VFGRGPAFPEQFVQKIYETPPLIPVEGFFISRRDDIVDPSDGTSVLATSGQRKPTLHHEPGSVLVSGRDELNRDGRGALREETGYLPFERTGVTGGGSPFVESVEQSEERTVPIRTVEIKRAGIDEKIILFQRIGRLMDAVGNPRNDRRRRIVVPSEPLREGELR